MLGAGCSVGPLLGSLAIDSQTAQGRQGEKQRIIAHFPTSTSGYWRRYRRKLWGAQEAHMPHEVNGVKP